MTIAGSVRRAAVVAGVIASLLLGAGAIRAAAEYTAAAAPLSVAPESMDSLVARLATEQARSAALQAQLDAVRTSTADLGVALDAARGTIETDTKVAAELQLRLTAARTRLAKLERSLAAAARAAAARTATAARQPAAAAPAAPRGEAEDDDD